MKLTEYRTMLYLPYQLYQHSLLAARRQKKSLAALIREALQRYLSHPEKRDYLIALEAGFGLWKNKRINGRRYERRLRSEWAKR